MRCAPVLRYMVLRLPEILAELIPVAALLAGLLSFAELARHSELTAIYAGGMSKLAARGRRAAGRAADRRVPVPDRGSGPPAASGSSAPGGSATTTRTMRLRQIWLRHGDEILRIGRIDPERAELRGVTIFRRDADGNLTAKIQAARAVAEGDRWMLFDVARSEVASASVETAARMPWAGDLDPADLEALIAKPSEMRLIDLLRVLNRPELGSQPVYRYATWLHERAGRPLTTAMLLLLTVALARPPRGRATQGRLVAIGIGVGFLLWTLRVAWCSTSAISASCRLCSRPGRRCP